MVAARSVEQSSRTVDPWGREDSCPTILKPLQVHKRRLKSSRDADIKSVRCTPYLFSVIYNYSAGHEL